MITHTLNQRQPPSLPQRQEGLERPVHSAEATVEQFRRSLADVLAALACLAGTNLGPDIPQPKEVQARGHSPGRGPTYSFDGNLFRYNTIHPIDGLCWRSTADPDELLYWVVDDVARSVAWAWAQRAPSARTMTTGQAQSILAMPLWHNLVNALNTDWGAQTKSTITYLKRNSAPRRPQATAP